MESGIFISDESKIPLVIGMFWMIPVSQHQELIRAILQLHVGHSRHLHTFICTFPFPRCLRTDVPFSLGAQVDSSVHHRRMFEMAKDEIVESQTYEIMAGYYSPV